jgi:hypothetical protein
MAPPVVTYQKLPGRGVELTSYFRLYLGPDHLLQVASSGYQERYKRFHFSDIQAMVLQRTSAFRVLNWIFGSLTAVCLGIWLLEALNGFAEDPAPLVILGVLTVCVAGSLVVNLLLGPTCVCYLRTAVQMERLAAIKRLRSAERVLDRLKPMIEATQGTLPPETIFPAAPGAGEPVPQAPPAA